MELGTCSWKRKNILHFFSMVTIHWLSQLSFACHYLIQSLSVAIVEVRAEGKFSKFLLMPIYQGAIINFGIDGDNSGEEETSSWSIVPLVELNNYREKLLHNKQNLVILCEV